MRKTFFSQSLVVGIIALFSLSGPLLAQQPAGSDRFTIEGTVVDNTNNEPIAGATVRLKSGCEARPPMRRENLSSRNALLKTCFK